MQLFGLTITRQKTLPQSLSPVSSRGGWWPIVREPFAGAWQRNVEIQVADVMTYSTVWACVTLIASDISKLWVKLVEVDDDGISTETDSPAFSPVLRTPNRYQTRVKFFEYWMLSKLIRGNTYALKQRDNRGVVVALDILDPTRVQVLVAPDRSVYYALGTDVLSGVNEASLTVPASEIIHDIMVPLYHPMVGVSPIHACAMVAMQGLRALNNSEKFFANQSQPGGILSTPKQISNETAQRLGDYWENQLTGTNAGRLMVVGDDLKFTPMVMSAKDAELVDQMKLTGLHICSVFHVPPWKVGLEPMPPYGNIQAGNIEYYSRALQGPIENLEELLVKGLELPRSPRKFAVEFDLAALLRMDTATQMEIAAKGVGAAIYSPNEARALFDLPPVAGGETPYLQQQNWPLGQLEDRPLPVPPMTPPSIGSAPDDLTEDDAEKELQWLLRKDLGMAA